MPEDNWQKVREIFDSALRRKPEERAVFIEKACGGDQFLLSEIRSLFASLDSADSFLEKPAVAAVADALETETKKLEQGAVLGHYEIVRQIGAGGMGEVYLAKDKKLDREVAVKILNARFSRDESNLKRFIREAKSASALNHPNILVIHEIGEIESAHYIVSEYVRGETLRGILRDTPPTLRETLDIAVQIAGALCAAHEARLIHRDIKPENIIVRPDGFIKVLDFGLAKLVERKNLSIPGLDDSTLDQSQTAKGMILGTVNYMSPEQAKGEQVDERTDIFSLGVLIYEMLAGKTPFAGDSIPETFAKLITQDAPPLSESIENPPAELERIVMKTLRKDKDARYQTMKDLLTDLKHFRENLTLEQKLERLNVKIGQETLQKRAKTGDANLQTGTIQNSISHLFSRRKTLVALILMALIVASTILGYYMFTAGKPADVSKKSIAVLPLKPINTANRDEIYELAIADSLINRINSMKGLVARPLNAIRKYSDVELDPIAAGREQQVDYVLASNYQLAYGKIRVSSQLFNVANGQIEETYQSAEKDAANVFALQDAISAEIGNKLLALFATTSNSSVSKHVTFNEEAYRLYLHGKSLTDKRKAEDAKKAVEYFEQAIRLDPNFARAYSGMAHAFIGSGNQGGGLPREEYEKAREAVKKALELDSELAEGYAVLGELKNTYEWDFAGAEKSFLRAIELEPNSELTHTGYAAFLSVRGRFDEAIAESKTALVISPNSYGVHRNYGTILYLARRYDEAITQFKRMNEIFGEIEGWLWLTYEMKGDYEAAYEWFMKSQSNPEKIELFKKAYETSGWQGIRQKVFEIEKLNEQKPFANYYRLARLAVLIGEKEQSFEYLSKAVEKRNGQIVMLNVEPAFDVLRGDPRFDELVKRVGLK